MAIIKGSTNYTYSGRKRKPLRGSRSRKLPSPAARKSFQAAPYRRETKHVPSLSTTASHTTKPESSYKQEASSKFTVAISHNKGAYQVIPSTQIKDIGK